MTIETCNFQGKKVIVRVDFNVPLDENGNITDATRIRGALPTLKKVLADGGALIIMSHMGKPKGKVNAKFSLSQIVNAVSEHLGGPVQFAPDCAKAAEAAATLKSGEVLLLENLRFYAEEEGKPRGLAEDATDDEKKAAKAAADKSIELLPVKDLLQTTGYIRGGCSPVGMKKKYPTYFDEVCLLFDEIVVSAGERGHQMILPVQELVDLVDGKLCDIIV